MVTMINTIGQTLVKHKHIIMLTIAAAALVAYMLPFDNMMGVADAGKKAKKSSYYKKDPRSSVSSRTTIGLAQSAVQNAGILLGGGGGGGGSYDGFQLGNTAFQFLQQSQQVCSGISFCPNTQLVQFTPYTLFGG
jgi:hypothetical protein